MTEVETYRQEAEQRVSEVKCAPHFAWAHQQASSRLELVALRRQNLDVSAVTVALEGEVEVRSSKRKETRDPSWNALLRGEHVQNRERITEIGLETAGHIEVLAGVEVADLESRDPPTSRESRRAALGAPRCGVEPHPQNRWFGRRGSLEPNEKSAAISP